MYITSLFAVRTWLSGAVFEIRITPFTAYVTACDLEKSFSVDTSANIICHVRFLTRVLIYPIANTFHIFRNMRFTKRSNSYRDLDGYSRSLKLSPFNGPRMISYSCSTATICLSRIVSDILSLIIGKINGSQDHERGLLGSARRTRCSTFLFSVINLTQAPTICRMLFNISLTEWLQISQLLTLRRLILPCRTWETTCRNTQLLTRYYALHAISALF